VFRIDLGRCPGAECHTGCPDHQALQQHSARSAHTSPARGNFAHTGKRRIN
jgi:hypothetical protein